MSKYVEFISDTKKEEHRIPGTDLYYFQIQTGVFKNGRKRYKDYALKTLGLSTDTKSVRDIIIHAKEKACIIYKMPEDVTDYKKFVELIDRGNVLHKVGARDDLQFSPIRQNFKLDANNNLLLKTAGADLEDDPFNGGDILLSAEGEVLKNTKGSSYIHPCDAFGNYPLDVFVNKTNKKTGELETIEIKHNFLDSRGHLYVRESFSKSEEPIIFSIHPQYRDESEGCVFLENKLMRPEGFVITHLRGANLYPSATALLIANRDAIANDPEDAIIADETEYLIKHFERYSQIKMAKEKLTKLSCQGKISFMKYKRAMNYLTIEEELMNLFEMEYQTKADEDIFEAIKEGLLGEDPQSSKKQ